jgi:hypothetical protein
VKTYLVFIEQCDDETIVQRMSGDDIRQYIKNNGHEGIAIVDGNLLKSFTNKIDLTKL